MTNTYDVGYTKCRVFAVGVMKACRGSKGIAPVILGVGIRWRCVVHITLGPLYPCGCSNYALHRRLGGPQTKTISWYPYRVSKPGSHYRLS